MARRLVSASMRTEVDSLSSPGAEMPLMFMSSMPGALGRIHRCRAFERTSQSPFGPLWRRRGAPKAWRRSPGLQVEGGRHHQLATEAHGREVAQMGVPRGRSMDFGHPNGVFSSVSRPTPRF